jgi:hypothetical protein
MKKNNSEENFSGKVNIENINGEKIITIKPYSEKWKTNLMVIWLILWSACGLVILSVFFSNVSKEQKLFFLVYLAFWFYFEWKILSVIRWRNSGEEILKINDETIVYEKRTAGRGIPIEVRKENIKSIETKPLNPVSFAAVFNNSYWMEGAETIIIEHKTGKISFGLQLNDSEQKKIIKVLQKK